MNSSEISAEASKIAQEVIECVRRLGINYVTQDGIARIVQSTLNEVSKKSTPYGEGQKDIKLFAITHEAIKDYSADIGFPTATNEYVAAKAHQHADRLAARIIAYEKSDSR